MWTLMTFAALASATFCLAAAVQVVTYLYLHPKALVGDEAEYAADSPPKTPWIRVPGQRWLIRGAMQIAGDRLDRHGRWATGLISSLGVAIAVTYVAYFAGGWAAVWTLILFLLVGERAVLALHLWPDIAIGVLALCAVLLMQSATPVAFVGLGVVAALALCLRIEMAALGGVAAVAPFVGSLPVGWDSFLPAMIVLAMAAALANSARRAHGTWLFDTSFSFNLAIEHAAALQPSHSTHALMKATSQRKAFNSPAPKAAPIPARIMQVLTRLRVLLGAESFVTQGLLTNNRPEYRTRFVLGGFRAEFFLLQYGFTAIFMLFCTLSLRMPVIVLGSVWVGIFLYAGLQTRSRYRMVLLPTMILGIGLGLGDVFRTGLDRDLLLGAALAVICAALLILAPKRAEI